MVEVLVLTSILGLTSIVFAIIIDTHYDLEIRNVIKETRKNIGELGMNNRLEKELQNKVIKYLTSRQIQVHRTQMGFESGEPDLWIVYRGMFVGIELKRPDGKGKPTHQQLKKQRDINKAGGFALITDNVNDVRRLLDHIDSFKFTLADIQTTTYRRYER